MKPHKQTEWYAILSDDEKLKVDEYTEKWPNTIKKELDYPFASFFWDKTPENWIYWLDESNRISLIINAKKQLEKLEGKPSPSMGVNTKPAHKMKWNGYWIDFDPKMPEHVFQHLRDLINNEK